MPFASITFEPISTDTVLQKVGGEADGAVVVFLGQVRNHNLGRPVSGMEYQGYEAMAESQLLALAEEAESMLDQGSVAVTHRLGALAIGDVSVAIAVASPHRAKAYEVSRFVIEEIKKRVPIWKREHYIDGSDGWLAGHDPQPATSGRNP